VYCPGNGIAFSLGGCSVEEKAFWGVVPCGFFVLKEAVFSPEPPGKVGFIGGYLRGGLRHRGILMDSSFRK